MLERLDSRHEDLEPEPVAASRGRRAQSRSEFLKIAVADGDSAWKRRPAQIGAILEDARNWQRIDIETLAERTKIRPKYLRALENEDWSYRPAYARGFIRAYADEVGIDRRCSSTSTGGATKRYGHLLSTPSRCCVGVEERARRPLPRRLILGAIVAEVAICC